MAAPPVHLCSVAAAWVAPLLAQSLPHAPYGPATAIADPGSWGPSAAVAADLDGDGDVDLAVLSALDERLAVYEQVVAGRFAARRILAEREFRGAALVAGDVEGDGDVDLVVAAIESASWPALPPRLLWFENWGDGTFGPPHAVLDHGARESALALVDLDRDGDLDLVSAASAEGALRVRRRAGPELLGAPETVDVFPPGFGIALEPADLDRDGWVDLAVAWGDPVHGGGVRWYRNFGGVLLPRGDLGALPGAADVAAGDVDADGDVDLVASFAGGVALFRASGLAVYSTAPVVIGAVPGGATEVSLADLDLDQDLDLLTVTRAPGGGPVGALVAFANLGASGFAPPESLGLRASWHLSLDVDGDGARDVAYGAADAAPVLLRRGLGAGAFEGPRDLAAAPVPGLADATADDLDGDGAADVLAVGRADGRVVWLPRQGAGFGAAVRLCTAPGATRVAVVDLDGDGGRDVLTAGVDAAWFARLGPGPGAAFASPVTLGPAFAAGAADLDGDGDLDVALAAAGALLWRPQLAPGRFDAPRALDGGTGTFVDVDFADLDSDGDVDIVAAANGRDPLAWYANLGGGAFAPGRPVPLPPGLDEAHRVVAADVDGDGRVDLVARLGARSVGVARGAGGGSFAAWVDLGLTDGAGATRALEVADVDGDGDLDVLFAATGTRTDIVLRENLGLGAFGDPRSLDAPLSPAGALDTADLDGDGDLDVLSARSDADTVAVSTHFARRVERVCDALPNSAGTPGRLDLHGSLVAADDRVTLTASSLPPFALGFFCVARQGGFAPNPGGSAGNLCLGGPIGRYTGPGQVSWSGSTGRIALRLALGATPTPTGAVAASAGETWWFQAWHRDVGPGGTTSNFTDAVRAVFE